MRKTFIELSTGHLTAKTRAKLAAIGKANASDDCGVMMVASTGFGWFVYVSDDGLSEDMKDLEEVFAWARAREISYLMFDQDADPIEGLTYYEDE